MFHEKNKGLNSEKISFKKLKNDDYLLTLIFDRNKRIRKKNPMLDEVEKINLSTRYK